MGARQELGADVLRSEEVLDVDRAVHDAGSVTARKVVDRETVQRSFPVGVEHADTERIAVDDADADSGEIETLPDGSISVPVFEEQLVVEKRLVVRERIVIRKHTVVEDHVIEATLRRERVEFDVDDAVAGRVAVED